MACASSSIVCLYLIHSNIQYNAYLKINPWIKHPVWLTARPKQTNSTAPSPCFSVLVGPAAFCPRCATTTIYTRWHLQVPIVPPRGRYGPRARAVALGVAQKTFYTFSNFPQPTKIRVEFPQLGRVILQPAASLISLFQTSCGLEAGAPPAHLPLPIYQSSCGQSCNAHSFSLLNWTDWLMRSFMPHYVD